jgi:hypothetical protein
VVKVWNIVFLHVDYGLFLLATLVLPVSASHLHAGIRFGSVDSLHVPVFDPTNGEVVFRLMANQIAPAEHRAGPFSIPKPGLQVDHLQFEFVSHSMSSEAWAAVLQLVKKSVEGSGVQGGELRFPGIEPFFFDRVPQLRPAGLVFSSLADSEQELAVSSSRNIITLVFDPEHRRVTAIKSKF